MTEIRDSAQARAWAVQGLCLQQVLPASEETIAAPLTWAMQLLADGHPLPPLGFIADVGHLVQGQAASSESHQKSRLPPVLPQAVVRTYEDYVLGKLYADAGFERGATAISRYREPDRDRGTAWLLARFAERAEAGGVLISPNILRNLLLAPREEVLAEGSASLGRDGPLKLLTESYARLIDRVRCLGDALAVEDVFELEHGTALVEFGQRLALRQMLQAAGRLEEDLPVRAPRQTAHRRDVPTHIRDEDIYPVGGFASIATRGTIESLLHSQLAYMEPAGAERPDLFDIKFLRDELLYYARDENQFLRRRRSFVIVLHEDLVAARVKDPDLPWQRIVLVLATVLVLVRRLIAWLSDEAVWFEVLFVGERQLAELSLERELLELALREQIANGTVGISTARPEAVARRFEELSRRSLAQLISISWEPRSIVVVPERQMQLLLYGAQPDLTLDKESLPTESDDLGGWRWAVETLLTWLR